MRISERGSMLRCLDDVLGEIEYLLLWESLFCESGVSGVIVVELALSAWFVDWDRFCCELNVSSGSRPTNRETSSGGGGGGGKGFRGGICITSYTSIYASIWVHLVLICICRK